ncbi:methionyl-tRNA synthetase [Gordonia bronchialis DSM 43247]|uniref:Methionine--tRNA ligase n=1 Tax=Gordonia bronchialis (strain ATCC 25592 / DSM 43247 / BCRC 13721 / JCM 3198 / KCTC 3076 / NBRC 16047 / NCTC 10667) TaxID=526226 RepID=D0L6Y3_GORB4|nr:methionine--tRNA ligase [Gordonia bronchialis]ACY20768.1 methionyl-tRNA synthetase [Gordonia bronchialis DSM 43247]MCC3323542.1 methionine--tRNA ligase [Gordonia bronchialis]QGS25485.1 methionine--tRNA ligase [Gordonia bronchialis]UAK38085.1 methionine--tRNA ligase [Gordonia bronchialis]STQ63601.1 Methionine--tRNA ligase [Gordonia bronchialis]
MAADLTSRNSHGDGRPYYITTAIAYPNGAPHIGHAYEYISADVLARFHRLDGYDVRFLTGTDVHGQKMQQTAEKEGIPTAELARRNSDRFQALQDRLGSSYHRFIRTSDDDHKRASEAIWQRMSDNGDIYLDKYSGWYDVRDETFYADSETSVNEAGERVATDTGHVLTWTEEETYFFRLSNYQDKLLELYESDPDFIGPDVRRNEVVSFVKGGLNDLSISRTTFDWGVPVPAHPDHVMYVWVDALTNYLTGAGFPDDEQTLRRYWPADLHIIGKDIIRFHCVYWPAFLMSAGIDLPKRVFVHGFLLNKGEKMSKSVGNVLDPDALIAEFGLDPVRYFFLREVSYGQDGSYSTDAIISRINADLANDFGNLAQRTLSMIGKYFDGALPAPGVYLDADTELLARADALLDTVRAHIEVQAIHLALEAMWSVLGETNRYISAQEPWKLAKTDLGRTGTVLYVCAEVVRIVALLSQPVMPASTAKLLDLLGVDDSGAARQFSAVTDRLAPGTTLPKPTPIFPRYEV